MASSAPSHSRVSTLTETHIILNSFRGSSSLKLYRNDIVQRLDSSDGPFAVVLRCWHDPEDIPPQASIADPLLRPLKQGEVGVTYIDHVQGNEILPESRFKLMDRCLQPGDYCKRSIDDMRSGVVLNVHVRGRLVHAISDEPVKGWKTSSDLQDKRDGEIGDYVVHDDWVGQIIEVFDESIVEVTGGKLVRLPELGSRLTVGDEGSDILPPAPAQNGMQTAWRSLWGSPTNSGGSKDKVIGVRHSIYAIAWLALNQMASPLINYRSPLAYDSRKLGPSEAEKKTRPRRFWPAHEMAGFSIVRGRSDVEMRVGDRVYLKDISGAPVTQHGNESDPAGIMQVQAYKVVETVSMFDVLWQDGVREKVRSIDVVPYMNPDEYDCWPGDHVLWKNEDGRRFAVVQSVDPDARTAKLHLEDSNTTELAPVLELDPNGSSDPSQNDPSTAFDGFGVRRGDFVFIHREGTTNGCVKPRVPRIGELEPWVRELPHLDGSLNDWRQELADLGQKLATEREPTDVVEKLSTQDSSLQWFGEVSEIRLDGNIEITHPDGNIKVYPVERLTRLYDGMEQLQDEVWDDSDVSDEYDDNVDNVWVMEEDGQWRPEDNLTGEWEDTDEEDAEDAMDVDVDPIQYNDSAMEDGTENNRADTQPAPAQQDPATPAEVPRSTSLLPSEESEHWQRFEILPSAPVDHAYYSTTPGTPSKAFLSRLQREYRALSSSLPESIVVRTYEDRGDLLRSLIIGPENTPYEDAPFVIDWMLDSNFPQSPPIAHFLSWTNGNGRVNPNLYEEGKVCLSILGTWVGDQSESWSPARSSLLQAFVSIQGLVLVKEPWFCEPAFDKLRGTEEGTINSRLYSEKAYVLSRGFIRRALEIPLGGLEKEIEWLYYANGGLEKVLRDSRRLIDVSKDHPELTPEDKHLAVPRLTAGGIITLERTLQKLQEIYDRRQNQTGSSGPSPT